MKKLLIIFIAILVFLGWVYLLFTYVLISPLKSDVSKWEEIPVSQPKEIEPTKEDTPPPSSREGKG